MDNTQLSNPYEPQHDLYQPDLLIVGGSSSGTAAAITAGRLGVNTVWVLRAPRDLGGLSTNAVNPDSDLPIRYIGGLALEYDVLARYSTGFNIGGKHNGEGFFAPFEVLFHYTRQQVDALPALTVLANLYPLAVEKDPHTQRVTAVTFAHRLQPGRRVTVRPRITIDAEIEGDVAYLAGVTMTLLREGRVRSDDPTRDEESYAGEIFTPETSFESLLIAGGAVMPGSTQAPDTQPATMAWNGSITLEDYGQGTPGSPWVLATMPDGYAPEDFAWWTSDNIYGVQLSDTQRRWNNDHYLSTVEGWRMPDGRHVLESMDVHDRETNEKQHLARVVRALWHLQHARKQYRYGLSHGDFREGLPAKYWLSDFGTRTNGGDAPLPGLIYMREGRRMVNDHVFGGKLIEDDGSGRFLQKRYWHPRAAYYNAMLVDIHGVHRRCLPGSGPEGTQLLRLAGFHNFGAPCIPFDVFVPRASEATGLLVSSAGAYTHQAYAAFPRMETGRIAQGHACAVAAYHALRDGTDTSDVDVRKVQITGLIEHGQSLVYFDDSIPGTHWHLVDQMLGARRVPERNEGGIFQREAWLTTSECRTYLGHLFHSNADHPTPPGQLAQGRAVLGDAADAPVTRATLLRALTALAGLTLPDAAPQPFADVPADTTLARLLAAWAARRWIAPDVQHRLRPDEPMPFSEFKRHAYHVLFGDVAPATVRPVDYRDRLAHDTFNRPDGLLDHLASGQRVGVTGAWEIAGGQLMAAPSDAPATLLVDSGQVDMDVCVDVFLEQTRQPATAGLLIRATAAGQWQRFMLRADGPRLVILVDAPEEGQTGAGLRAIEPATVRPALKRGFTLRALATGDTLTCYLDGVEVHRQRCESTAAGTYAGLINMGEASRFDNFEVRAAR